MQKYVYVIVLIYTFFSFMIGWNHTQEYGFTVFGLGFMSMTPITVVIMTFVWLRERDMKELREDMIDIDNELR